MSLETKAAISDVENYYLEMTGKLFQDDERWFNGGRDNSIFTPAMTVWLLILQVLHEGSLSDALKYIRQGLADKSLSKNRRRTEQLTQLSESTGAYAQARHRLEEGTLIDIVEELTKRAYKEKAALSEIPAVLLDGTTLTLQKGSAIEGDFPLHRNSRGACLPKMRLVFASDVHTGAITAPSFDKSAVSEQKLSYAVLEQITKGTVVIADRNFGVFSVVSRATRCELSCITRLTESRAKRILGRSVPQNGEFEVTWNASSHDQLNSDEDPRSIKGRIISRVLERDGFKPISLVVFTTATHLSPDKIIELYGKRHFIELDIRQLKVTLEADYIRSKSAAMIRKELLVRFAVFNLVQCIIEQATRQVGLSPREVSFKAMLRNIKVLGQLTLKTSSPEEEAGLWSEFLQWTRQNKHPNRLKRRPSYPRRVRRNMRTYPINREGL